MDLNPKNIEEQYEKEVNGLVKKAGALLRSKYGLWFLGILTFADSALGLPFSMDPFMVAYMAANRAKAWWGYVVTVLGSVLGGIVAYLLAAFFINQILGLFTPEMTQGFQHLVKLVDRGAFLFSFFGSFSPVPYTLVAVTAGALKVNPILFVVGSLCGRAIRFGGVAYFVHFFGPRAVEIAKRHVLPVSALVLVLVVLAVLFSHHF